MTGTDLERAKTISGAVNFIIDREKTDEKDTFLKEALMLHQSLSLCSSMVDETMRFEAAFFESVRVLTMRLTNTSIFRCERRIFFIRFEIPSRSRKYEREKFGGRGFEKIDFRAGISI